MVYGSFNNFNAGSFFTNLDVSTLVYAIFFLIVLWITLKALSRIFPYQKSIALVLSILVSIFAVWVLSKANFNFESLLYNVGFSTDFLLAVAPWILLAAMVIIIWTTGFGALLMITGGIFLFLGVTDLVYERGFAMFSGVGLLFFGWILFRRRKRRRAYKSMSMKDRSIYKMNRGDLRRRNWGHVKTFGKVIGAPVYYPAKGVGWLGKKSAQGIGKGVGKGYNAIKERRRKFEYIPGMKKGGKGFNKNLNVSSKAARRYARMYGNQAAKKRFG